MTDQQDVTLGEMARSLARIETAVVTLQATVLPLGALMVRVEKAEDLLDKIEPKVDRVLFNAATISGGVAAIAWLLSWLSK